MEDLRKEWDAATDFTAGDVSEKWWSTLKKHYTEKDRSYHNEDYLKRIFISYHKYQDKLQNSKAIALAIFFHK